jgi:hypothetical protein
LKKFTNIISRKKIAKLKSKAVSRSRTKNKMDKGKRTKYNTMLIYKQIHRKLKIEQYE